MLNFVDELTMGTNFLLSIIWSATFFVTLDAKFLSLAAIHGTAILLHSHVLDMKKCSIPEKTPEVVND